METRPMASAALENKTHLKQREERGTKALGDFEEGEGVEGVRIGRRQRWARSGGFQNFLEVNIFESHLVAPTWSQSLNVVSSVYALALRAAQSLSLDFLLTYW